jgi:heat shock protein HslJ
MVSSEQLQNKWMLYTIIGVPNERISPEAYIDLSNTAKSGAKAGCNQMFFSYEMSEKNKIKFSGVGSTRMACPDMAAEEQLLKLFPLIDNVEIRNDMLVLKIGSRDVVTAKRSS